MKRFNLEAQCGGCANLLNDINDIAKFYRRQRIMEDEARFCEDHNYNFYSFLLKFLNTVMYEFSGLVLRPNLAKPQFSVGFFVGILFLLAMAQIESQTRVVKYGYFQLGPLRH